VEKVHVTSFGNKKTLPGENVCPVGENSSHPVHDESSRKLRRSIAIAEKVFLQFHEEKQPLPVTTDSKRSRRAFFLDLLCLLPAARANSSTSVAGGVATASTKTRGQATLFHRTLETNVKKRSGGVKTFSAIDFFSWRTYFFGGLRNFLPNATSHVRSVEQLTLSLKFFGRVI
jgi:hypothetical protein